MTLTRSAYFAAILLANISFATQAIAQTNDTEIETLRAEVALLKKQLAAISAKLDAVSGLPRVEQVKTAEAEKATATEIHFKGAPELSIAEGWSFKPRGRLQVDLATINPSKNIISNSVGTGVEIRRAQIGFDGAIPGGFVYRLEANFANSSVDLTDAYISYKAGAATITLGQQKSFWGLEDMTNDLFSSFTERAAFHSAFGFERRVGLSATYAAKDVLAQGGIFSDNAADLNIDNNNSRSFDGRVVFMPKTGDTQLHFGASAHFRKYNDFANTARYRAIPFTRMTELRLADTRSFTSAGENSFGLEGFLNNGRFHTMAEGHWLNSHRPEPLVEANFFGVYAQIGYFLTDDTLGYKTGAVDRVRVTKPFGKGGLGALQLNARYDYLDLIDAGILGGKQQTLALSLIWNPQDYLRLIANYGRVMLDGSPVLASGSGTYDADVVGFRAQLDF